MDCKRCVSTEFPDGFCLPCVEAITEEGFRAGYEAGFEEGKKRRKARRREQRKAIGRFFAGLGLSYIAGKIERRGK